MTSYKTEQENFWSGEFGDDYITRNRGEFSIASNLALFSKILSKTHKVRSLIEFGANIGLNLQAIQLLLPEVKISAVEINSTAVKELEKMGGVTVENKSILDYLPQNKFDFTLIKGVLIHINPDYLSKVYEILYQSSNRYICVVEYYNPSPVTVNYRGHQDRLFKRDFAGEMLDKFQNLSLIDYGFVYHRDTNFPQDDLTWFLMEKS
jgi:spore coat polysaccharide biosynthesis protein SpsF